MNTPEQAVERDTCALIADRLAARHRVADENFFAISAPERDFIIAELRKAAALPSLVGVQRREDVARALLRFRKQPFCPFPADAGTNEDYYNTQTAFMEADAVLALPHTEQQEEGEKLKNWSATKTILLDFHRKFLSRTSAREAPFFVTIDQYEMQRLTDVLLDAAIGLEEATQALSAAPASPRAEGERRHEPLAVAARRLANAADGLSFAEVAVREAIGNTNWSVLRHWIDEVRAALSPLVAEKPPGEK